jgi:hypothetical protein
VVKVGINCAAHLALKQVSRVSQIGKLFEIIAIKRILPLIKTNMPVHEEVCGLSTDIRSQLILICNNKENATVKK